MSRFREGQKVFGYMVIRTEGDNVLKSGARAEGKILLEARGKGPTNIYEFMSPEGDFSFWFAQKIGRGFIHGDKVEWEDSALKESDRLYPQVGINGEAIG